MDECGASPLCRKFCSLKEVIKYEPEDFYYKVWFLLLINKYYCKYVFIRTYFSHYILSVSFGSLLSAIVHLLLQINVRRNMCTALFCVVCALPVFIMTVKGKIRSLTDQYVSIRKTSKDWWYFCGLFLFSIKPSFFAYLSVRNIYSISYTFQDAENEDEFMNFDLPDPDLEPGILPTEIRKLVQSRRQVKAMMKDTNLPHETYIQVD